VSGDFQPHGFCYRWNSGLVWLNVLSDALIALAYFTIPFTLLWFIRKRRDLPFSWMFALFGVFIIACGTTHVMEVWNLWHAQYWLAGIIKAITALASILTAILLVQLVPKALALPSPDELKEVNRHLVERTKELARANAELASGNKALQHFQEQQRLLFDSIPYPVWVYESYTLAIKDVNLSAIRSYGYSREEFLSLTIKDLRPAEDIPALLENAKKTPEGAETAGSCKHRKKNGDLIDVEITSGTVVFEGRDARLVVATDVTERKQAEEALRQSDERLSLLVHGVQDYAILMLDPEGRITTWNEGAERIKGYRAEEIIGEHFSKFYPPEAVAQDKPSQELKIAAEQGRFEEEGWRVRKDGSLFWASVVITALLGETGQLRGFGKVTRDITERKQEDRKFRNLLEAAPDAMVMVNRAGEIQLVNTQTEKLFGYAREEILGKPVEILIPKRFHGRHEAHRTEYSVSPSPRAMGAELELYGLRKDGKEFAVEISLSPIETNEGTLTMSAMIEIVLRSWDDLTGGYVGLAGIPTVWSGQPIAFYALAVVVLAMAVLAYENLMLSRFGRGLTTIRADRARAMADGIPVPGLLSAAFALAAAMAGAGGWLYAHYFSYLGPGSLGTELSISVLLMMVVGGARNILGPVAGAVILGVLAQLLPAQEVQGLFYGGALIVILLVARNGLLGLVRREGAL